MPYSVCLLHTSLDVQVGEQVVPVTSAGYYYPVASGVPACFTGDTMVETPSGRKRMEELKIGDLVLTAEQNTVRFFTMDCSRNAF